VGKFSKGKSNFEIVLAFQNCFFGRDGLSYNPSTKNRPLTSFFENRKLVFKPIITCFYCLNKGHIVRFCRLRKFDLPKGLVKWVPKDSINIFGPKFIRESNLVPGFVLVGILDSPKKHQ